MPKKLPKRRMRNLLLDKPFQLKYTLAVVLVSSIISAGLGTLLYQAHRESSQVASLDDPFLDSALQDELKQEDRKVLFSLIIFPWEPLYPKQPRPLSGALWRAAKRPSALL